MWVEKLDNELLTFIGYINCILLVEKDRENKLIVFIGIYIFVDQIKKLNRNQIIIKTIDMAQGQQFLIFTMVTLVFLMMISKCYSYPSFREIPSM